MFPEEENKGNSTETTTETTTEAKTTEKTETSNKIKVSILGKEYELTPEEHSQLLIAGVQKVKEMNVPREEHEDPGDQNDKKQEEPDVVPGEDAPADEQIKYLRKQMVEQTKRFENQISQIQVQNQVDSTKRELDSLLDSNEETKSGKTRSVVARLALQSQGLNPKIPLSQHFAAALADVKDMNKPAKYIKEKLEDGERTKGEKTGSKTVNPESKKPLTRAEFKKGGALKRALSRFRAP